MRVAAALAGVAVLFIGLALATSVGKAPAELSVPDRGKVRAEWLDDGTPVFVTRRGDAVHVVDARSPMSGDADVYVAFCASTLHAWEPFYGSSFAHDGTRLGGPATTGLATFDTKVVDNRLIVGDPRPPTDAADGRDPNLGWSECAWTFRHPDAIHHFRDRFQEARSPEETAASDHPEPVLVLGAVERIGSDIPRACAWEITETITGPLCHEEAPKVEMMDFAFLGEGREAGADAAMGSYGLFLITSAEGQLRVRAMLPDQIEYTTDERVVIPPETAVGGGG